MVKSNYFSNTHALQTRPKIDGVRSSVAYSTQSWLGLALRLGAQIVIYKRREFPSAEFLPIKKFQKRLLWLAAIYKKEELQSTLTCS